MGLATTRRLSEKVTKRREAQITIKNAYSTTQREQLGGGEGAPLLPMGCEIRGSLAIGKFASRIP